MGCFLEIPVLHQLIFQYYQIYFYLFFIILIMYIIFIEFHHILIHYQLITFLFTLLLYNNFQQHIYNLKAIKKVKIIIIIDQK
jgi:hypothetical protein